MATYVLGPRVTEKTARGSENNVYTFNISRNADKRRVARAIKEIYGVVPFQVRIISVRNKGVFFRGKRGKTSGGKKAYVYLRKEDKIEVL
ncbi:MAG: 50S ribosomal protein L23 [Candidatus Taylorbacteria bacterium RIFCSPLOWO2_12_FULL_43_20]|uniref:50S ribosomal protein L23 n=1 Tax=Candidatus Taylorbacteria bacterium RIFCSPLOWO2_12_FULL_43_20 TaxID=1802332 RepID=A0A1G2P2D2_9BACT|nr:MAG: 50S ribosomal protein L23 [Candidatus Taylorbacteria bacterium RIFCSPHIGHO2_01_FULL_43_120]OHA23479.1 MAG: 50S ribosomal protein L23 [Candidatus Taylorbacteria bacterium RIFCSPHIGHO2_02_FULL_43_55]OHA29688.1 MAG: 50S ribosomal protein L23 [Candidatus Taylorbacteria bacterium RIFCSPHIGHO2_12_FULL_42_34]OHA31614.1 MAG: 50S ribosomal protein L23 [Candidatus Taylorbacteria bacterium RIFCSPLOWO2_01_FULL_43_83]OHA38996.1 MAG: 50S ribosomal protein L23 [Candidatus Taylorbacteria bacterium RIFC